MTISSKRMIDLETLLMCILFILIAFSALSYILISQTDLTTSSWWPVHRNIKTCITFLCLFFLLQHYSRNNKIDFQQVRVFCCLVYVCFVAVFMYFPSIKIFLADAFAWPLTFIVCYTYALTHENIGQFKGLIVLCHYACCALLVRTILINLVGGYANAGSMYHAIAYLPIVLLISKQRDKLILSIFVCVLIVLSAKRTGIIALGLGFLSYNLIGTMIQENASEKIKRTLGLCFLGAIVFAIAMHYSSITENILERFGALSVDQGSGRMFIWQTVYDRFVNSSTLNKLIGHGVHAVPHFIRPFNKAIFSHNSYLEYLYDLGIVGVTILLIEVIRMIWFLIKLIKEKNEFAPTAAFAISIVLAFSLFSYFFEESNYIFMVAAYWGFIRGTYIREKRKEIGIAQ